MLANATTSASERKTIALPVNTDRSANLEPQAANPALNISLLLAIPTRIAIATSYMASKNASRTMVPARANRA